MKNEVDFQKFSLRINKNLQIKLKYISDYEGLSMNELITKTIENHIEKERFFEEDFK